MHPPAHPQQSRPTVPADWNNRPGFIPKISPEEFLARFLPPPPCDKLQPHIIPTIGQSSVADYTGYMLPPNHYMYPPRGSQAPRRCLPVPLGPPFRRQHVQNWGLEFYIRIDHVGLFHTYPHVGGPFQSLHEVDSAIGRYLHARQDPKMFTMDNVSPVDIAVRQCLYWPDGTRKKCLGSCPIDEFRDRSRQLAHALVDKYNEDHYLFGDLAYKLKEVVDHQSIHEGDFCKSYHHINFTAKTKGAADLDIDNLFFAEVIFVQRDEEMPVTCLCMVKPTDNGVCYGCINGGSVDMKHPNDVGYAGGHVENAFSPYGPNRLVKYCRDDDDDLEAKEARLKREFQCLNDLPERMGMSNSPGQ